MDAKPPITTPEEWQRARDELLVAEKEATRALDALAARRRRLPMVAVDVDRYVFEGPDGPTRLRDLFGSQPQLAVYQFMDRRPGRRSVRAAPTSPTTSPPWTRWPSNGVAWANVSDMPLAQIEDYNARMGWTMPFVSSRGTSFAKDCGPDGGFLL